MAVFYGGFFQIFNYIAEVKPPSTVMINPFTKDASSEAKKTAAGPISSTRPHRPTGVLS